MSKISMMTYIKEAFMYHWNLLIFGSGITFGIIAGNPDIAVPLMLAGELAYLSVVSTNSSFQRYIDARQMALADADDPNRTTSKTQAILKALSPEDRLKFSQITTLCLKLQQIARQQQLGHDPVPQSIADVQVEGVNRLLWIYLKLLYSKNALDNFFKTTSKADILDKIDKSEKRLEALDGKKEVPKNKKERREALIDTLETSRARLTNYEKAVYNYEFIELELERLYTKIAGLAEMSINRQDPRTIISEMDIASSSVKQTEQAINDLETYAEIPLANLEPPDLLGRNVRDAHVKD